MHKLGNVYIPSGLNNLELLLLTCYIRLLIKGSMKYPYAYGDTEDIYTYLGGTVSDIESTLFKGKQEGLLGSYVDDEPVERRGFYDNYPNVPLISGNRGYEELQKILGKMSGGRSRLIVAGTKFSARMNFVEFLSELPKNEEIRLVDSYIDSFTLHPFASMKSALNKLRIITHEITENDSIFKKKVSEFVEETGIKLEMKQSDSIHDRYIIYGNEIWSLGASIKDLGNKDAIVSKVDTLTTSISDLFEIRWEAAKQVKLL